MPLCDKITVMPEVANYAVVLLLIMTAASAITYFASQFLKKPEWEVFAKVELYQIFSSVLLLIFVVFMFQFSNVLANGALHYFLGKTGSFCDSFDIGKAYLSSAISNVGIPLVTRIRLIGLTAQSMSSLYLKGGSSGWGYNILMFPLNMIDNNSDFILFVMLPIVTSLEVQLAILQMIQATYVYFLSAGLILRILPPTRNAGSFLFMLALAFYVIFPLTYVMHYIALQTMFTGSSGLVDPDLMNNPFSIGNYGINSVYLAPSNWVGLGNPPDYYTDPWKAHFIQIDTTGMHGMQYFIEFSEKTIAVLEVVGSVTGMPYLLSTYFRMFNMESLLILEGLLLPALSFIITSGFIKTMIRLAP